MGLFTLRKVDPRRRIMLAAVYLQTLTHYV